MQQHSNGSVFSHKGQQSTCSPLFHQLEMSPCRQVAYRAQHLLSRWTLSWISDLIPNCSAMFSQLLERCTLCLRVFLLNLNFFFFFFMRSASLQSNVSNYISWNPLRLKRLLYALCIFFSSTVSFLPAPMMEQLQFPQTSPPCVSQQHPGQQYTGTEQQHHQPVIAFKLILVCRGVEQWRESFLFLTLGALEISHHCQRSDILYFPHLSVSITEGCLPP